MNPRVFCNIVYARLVEHADVKERERIVGEIYAPLDHKDDISTLIANLDEDL